MNMWKCQVCGLVLEVTEPPEKCPKCGAPREQFRELSSEEADLIRRSRKSNYLHMEAVKLLKRLIDIAEEGISDNLDPGCVKIFTEERDFAKLTIQKIMAELETHVKKNKWN
ncbi:MAG: rubredoxin [Desulfurococcaceae archaeon]